MALPHTLSSPSLDSESTGDKLARTLPLVAEATGGGLLNAVHDAWNNKIATAGELGLSVGIGAVIATVQDSASSPRLAVELGLAALGFAAVKQIFTNAQPAFSAIKDAWDSPNHLDQDRKAIAASLGPLLFDTLLTGAGAAAGAGLARTIPVRLQEGRLLDALGEHHAETVSHSQRVAELSKLTAKEMGLPRSQQSAAYHAGLMHDVGKLDIPETILSKPTELTTAEMETVSQHPVFSHDRLEQIPYKGALKEVPIDALHHHEWVDGTGYPDHLTGAKMTPVELALPPVDVLDSVTSGRLYARDGRGFGERMQLGEVKQLIDGGKGTHFDPAAVDALWKIPADKALTVLESNPVRPSLGSGTLGLFKGFRFGRLLDIMNGAAATPGERRLSSLFNEIYSAPNAL